MIFNHIVLIVNTNVSHNVSKAHLSKTLVRFNNLHTSAQILYIPMHVYTQICI